MRQYGLTKRADMSFEMTELIAKIQSGSIMFGTNTDASDTDISTIYLPSPKAILLGEIDNYDEDGTTNKNGKNTANDIDVKNYDILRFAKMLISATPDVIELLFAPEQLHLQRPSDVWKELQSMMERIISADISIFKYLIKKNSEIFLLEEADFEVLRRFQIHLDDLVMVAGKKEKFRTHSAEILGKLGNQTTIEPFKKRKTDGQEEDLLKVANKSFPMDETLERLAKLITSIIRSSNVDDADNQLRRTQFKMLYHAARLTSEASELVRSGYLTFPRPDRQLLVDIKAGRIPLGEVRQILDSSWGDMLKAQSTSVLPQSPDQDAIEAFVANAHMKTIFGNMDMPSTPDIRFF